ncbi:hypothetical protein GCM10025867_03910 [Frondihabitans sucicola]|uniref:UspA domain-containing protein n=1 Tax=Frondihabitans sucicola TaxID=1268041 RepID=A0ABM8GIE4_9MICO|nr:universal stress protein [Frondihabitans sucicola]BDZ48150.1 hypothetical protein GCM10025867_03910 [Frondihabitans sucicola]
MGQSATLVVGVTSHQPRTVIEQALVFARRFDASLVCVQVDPSRFVVDTKDDGTIVAAPFDPDGGDVVDEGIDPDIVSWAAPLADSAGIACSFVATAGDPARMLAQVADEVGAILIVVGTRRPTLGATVRQFFAGSVSAGLTHRQHRPVVVVPLDPVSPETPLPWDATR